MNAAGARPVGDQLLDLAHRLAGVAARPRRRGTCRGSCSATPLCAPNRAGWQARSGCRRSTSTPHRCRTSTRGTPRGPRRRRAGRWRRVASRIARSLASEPELTRNTVSSGSGSSGGEPLAELDHRLVVEARVGVEPAQLAGRGVGDPRMGVAEHRDVVDHVEVAPARRWTSGSAASRVRSAAAWVVVLLHLARSSRRGAPADRRASCDFGDAASPAPVADPAERKPARRQLRRVNVRRGRRTDRPHAQFGPSARRACRERFAGAHGAVRNPGHPGQGQLVVRCRET